VKRGDVLWDATSRPVSLVFGRVVTNVACPLPATPRHLPALHMRTARARRPRWRTAQQHMVHGGSIQTCIELARAGGKTAQCEWGARGERREAHRRETCFSLGQVARAQRGLGQDLRKTTAKVLAASWLYSAMPASCACSHPVTQDVPARTRTARARDIHAHTHDAHVDESDRDHHALMMWLPSER